MTENRWKSRKVVITGAGAVGSTFAYALAQSGTADEICLVDLNKDFLQGQVLDLAHGMPYYPPVDIYGGDKEDYKDAHVIVITAGAKQKQGETRLDLLKRNAAIMEHIIDEILESGSNAVIVVVSNPVDVLTYVAMKRADWPHGRILGSGTVLDSARFRYLISEKLSVNVRNVHAYIMGEHGDSEFAAWTMTNIAGVPINDYCKRNQAIDNWPEVRKEIVAEVRNSAYHIIDYKGATNFGVGLALVQIVGSILQNQQRILTVSTLLKGEYGLNDVCLSIPCVLSQEGVKSIVLSDLSQEETDYLNNSANILKQALDNLKD
ncbi:MAG TPA: L-lactate dehydrogenase [Balneolales bacterium]|nr:L-lactate dehydrogenase [Balneolales bacterium]